MLCYSGLGDAARSERERRLYLRFKADESAQAITGEYRRTHPEDNNERQPIHENVSVPLPGTPSKAGPAAPLRRSAAVANNVTGGN
jgi:hypothetical protein